jgi:hypothetical protein
VRALAAGLLVALLACERPPATGDVAASVYAAERLRCVHGNDAAAPARACMRRVDDAFGQDGGL